MYRKHEKQMEIAIVYVDRQKTHSQNVNRLLHTELTSALWREAM